MHRRNTSRLSVVQWVHSLPRRIGPILIAAGLIVCCPWIVHSQATDPPPAADSGPGKLGPESKSTDSKALIDPAAQVTDAKTSRTPESRALIQKVMPSIVTIRVKDRDGGQLSIGTGFVIDASGLIATNHHVLTEGREFTVELWPRKPLKVLAVEATDVLRDSAIIRVEPPAEGLTALALANDDEVQQGVSVFAFGHPMGLEHSVVQGIISALRELQGQSMIQLAMPIEPGNSGGPLVDPQGRVLGIVNMKSLQTDNLGFAVPIASIRALLNQPNPIRIERWVHSPMIDDQTWQVVFGADWRERSGTIHVRGVGNSFGGRSLCLQKSKPPEPPYEVSVKVKLSDEAGAAGLVFHSDGSDRHYGFYPSNGNLRLTCFKGPFVDSWQVLGELNSKHYKAGGWNELKVRVEKDRLICYVNDHEVFTQPFVELQSGLVGIAKFRDTVAEFKRFHTEPVDTSSRIDEVVETVDRLLINPSKWEAGGGDLPSLASERAAIARELKRRTARLERQINQMQQLGQDLELAPALSQLRRVLDNKQKDELSAAALWIAAMDNTDLDVNAYLRKLERMAEQVKANLKPDATAEDRMVGLNRFLFEENGYHGSRQEYYHRANSHLDRVIDDREGLPITLSILYMDLARRIDLPVVGIGLPGHFVVGWDQPGEQIYIDVFDSGKRMNRQEAERLVLERSGRLPIEADFRPQSTREILIRVLRNLIGIAQEARDDEALVRYSSGLTAIDPHDPQYRMMLCIARYRTGRLLAAKQDVQWLQGKPVFGIGPEELARLNDAIARELAE